jgi:hypothetical protein
VLSTYTNVERSKCAQRSPICPRAISQMTILANHSSTDILVAVQDF